VRTGWRHFLRAELNNLLLRFIRTNLAHHVVYQSHFAQQWWEGTHGKTPVGSSVVYNGVPLEVFTPEGEEQPPTDHVVVLMVEGNLGGGYEVGVGLGVELIRKLQDRMPKRVDLRIAGNASQDVRTRWDEEGARFMHWLGLVAPEHIPSLDRSAHVLYSGDPNPACPNSVIEALACGLPVVAFKTGALPELVSRDSGKLVDYGGDPWRLEQPNVEALVEATVDVLAHQEQYRMGAREQAVEKFSLESMVEDYLAVFRIFS
jgi:glycosyltransferase involved in cell wall biosynthesis